MGVVFHVDEYDEANNHFSQICKTPYNIIAHTKILPPLLAAEGTRVLDKFLIPKFHSSKI